MFKTRKMLLLRRLIRKFRGNIKLELREKIIYKIFDESNFICKFIFANHQMNRYKQYFFKKLGIYYMNVRLEFFDD